MNAHQREHAMRSVHPCCCFVAVLFLGLEMRGVRVHRSKSWGRFSGTCQGRGRSPMQQLQGLKLATTFSSLFFLTSTPSLSSSVPELLSTEAASSRHACSKPSPHPRSLHRTPLHRSAPTISTMRQPVPTSHKHPAICLDPGTAASLHLSYPASVKAIPPIHRHRHCTTPAHAPRPQPRKPLRHLQDPHPSRRKR